MKKAVLLVDYFGKWVDDKISWRWNSQNDTVRTMLVSGDVTFDKFMESIIRRGELSCGHDHICVKYMTNTGTFLRDKAPPVEIMNDEDVQIYLNDINHEGGRPILGVYSIEKSLENGCGLSNHQSEDVLSSRVEKEVPRDNEDVLPCQVEKDISLDNEDVLPYQFERDSQLDNKAYFCKSNCRAYQREIREQKGPTPNEIKNIVSKELGCDVSYWTCWMAKQLAQNMICGTPEHGYAKLEAYHYEIEKANEALEANALVRETRREIPDKLSVHQLHVNEFIVQGDSQDARVNINAKTCTCRVWDLQQLSCTHALAARRAQ
ncbi:hypothetical protein BC332_21050 [Capsicum chinense]|nr:hypothetical protein BC332_21050 [Capsicum chinense]